MMLKVYRLIICRDYLTGKAAENNFHNRLHQQQIKNRSKTDLKHKIFNFRLVMVASGHKLKQQKQ